MGRLLFYIFIEMREIIFANVTQIYTGKLDSGRLQYTASDPVLG